MLRPMILTLQNFKVSVYLFNYVHVYGDVHTSTSTHRGRRSQVCLELELQVSESLDVCWELTQVLCKSRM